MATSRSRRAAIAASNTPGVSSSSLGVKIGIFLVLICTLALYRHIERTYSDSRGGYDSFPGYGKDGTRTGGIQSERERNLQMRNHLIDDLSDDILDMEERGHSRDKNGDGVDARKRICIVTAVSMGYKMFLVVSVGICIDFDRTMITKDLVFPAPFFFFLSFLKGRDYQD